MKKYYLRACQHVINEVDTFFRYRDSVNQLDVKLFRLFRWGEKQWKIYSEEEEKTDQNRNCPINANVIWHRVNPKLGNWFPNVSEQKRNKRCVIAFWPWASQNKRCDNSNETIKLIECEKRRTIAMWRMIYCAIEYCDIEKLRRGKRKIIESEKKSTTY